MRLNPVYLGSRNLRRSVAKLKAAIDDEIKSLIEDGKTEEEASKIVSLQLELLGSD